MINDLIFWPRLLIMDLQMEEEDIEKAVTNAVRTFLARYEVRPYTISKKLGYSLSPQPPLERGALVDRCVAPVDRNGISF
jgi:hypothetical protein